MAGDWVFQIAFWVLFGLLLVIRAVSALMVCRAGERLMPDHKAVQREGGWMFTARVMAFFLLIGLLALYALNSPVLTALSIPLPDWLRWTGVALGLASLAFWAWAQAELGKEWSPQLQVRKKHRLVTTGPYVLVRHPIYTAMFGWGLSVALVTANWIFLLLAVVMVAGLLARVPREERMMVEEFGKEYKSYMERMGRFFPRLH